MSIKAVDFQVMLPKTSEISKVHNDEQHKNQSFQQQQNMTVQSKAEEKIRYVHSQDKASSAYIKEKQEREKKGRKEEKKRIKGNYGCNKETEAEIQINTIDICL